MRRAIQQRGVRRAAFTLVELLVVVAIIGVLAAMLLPALNGAYVYVLDIQCKNNLKQIAMATLNYISDYRGSIPPTSYVQSKMCWCDLLVKGNYLTAQDSSKAKDTDPAQAAAGTILLCPVAIDSLLVKTSTTITLPALLGQQASKATTSDYAQGFARLGNSTKLMVDCSYYWNGCGTWINPAQTSDARLRLPSLTVDDSPGKTKADQAPSIHDISEVRQRTTLVMATDGVLYIEDSSKNRGRIAARHKGPVQDHTGNPDDKYFNTHTNMVFYDAHVEGYDRDQGQQDDFAPDLVQSAVGLDMGTITSPLFLLPKH